MMIFMILFTLLDWSVHFDGCLDVVTKRAFSSSLKKMYKYCEKLLFLHRLQTQVGNKYFFTDL